jgi:hypothetical protein
MTVVSHGLLQLNELINSRIDALEYAIPLNSCLSTTLSIYRHLTRERRYMIDILKDMI